MRQNLVQCILYEALFAQSVANMEKKSKEEVFAIVVNRIGRSLHSERSQANSDTRTELEIELVHTVKMSG